MQLTARMFRGFLALALASVSFTSLAQFAAPSKNKPPTVSITSPLSGTSFAQGAPITLTATASDSDGTVTKVEFFDGATSIGSVGSSPYTVTWPNASVGTHNNVTAKATDNAGATTTSAAITVIVVANPPPTVSITSPGSGAVFTAPANIGITATASDNGPIQQVEFFHDNVSIGAVATSPYGITWPNVAAGSYQLTAKATDTQGATTTSAAVPITVGAPPLVVITQPDNCTTVSPPAGVTLAADAIDLNGWITSVDFFDGSTLVGTATRLPYSVTFSNIAQGQHTLTAVATNNLGIPATSAQITLNCTPPNQLPTATITDVTPSTNVRTGMSVSITASANDPDGTVQYVEFFRGGIFIDRSDGPIFTVRWIAQEGTWNLTAVAHDDKDAAGLPSLAVPITVAANPPPSVTLQAPLGGSYRAPATISFSADASDSDGIRTVEFLLNGVSAVTSTSTSSPYTATKTGVPAGSYSVVAKATDNLGAFATSTQSVTITVANNAAPIVSIFPPADGAAFTAPVDIPITVNATDPDGTIAKVELFADGGLIGTSTAAAGPYNFTWVNASLGSHQLQAKATDNDGAVSLSAVVSITVTGIRAAITAPPDGSTYVAPAGYDVVAAASTSSGNLTQVEFYDGAALLQTFNIPAGFANATVTLTLTGVAGGAHIYTVKAYDSSSRIATSAAVNVNVTTPATVSLTSPAQDATYIAPAFITLAANAIAGSNPIARVDFYAGATLVASVNSSPYTFGWSGVSAGNYTLTAIATDAANNQVTSSPVSVFVASSPAISIDAGISGSSVPDNRITVTGTAILPPNAGVIVNNVLATLDGHGGWFVDNVPLNSGANTLTATAATLDFNPVSTSANVTSTGNLAFDVAIDPPNGIATYNAIVTLQQRAAVDFGRAEFDFDSDGITDYTTTSLTNGTAQVQITISQPRSAVMTVKVFDTSNTLVYTAQRHYLAVSGDQMSDFISGEYSEMLRRLSTGDITGGLRRFTDQTRNQYQAVFTFLGSNLSAAITALGTVTATSVSDSTAEVEISRTTANGTKVYPITFVRGSDGVWRIEGM